MTLQPWEPLEVYKTASESIAAHPWYVAIGEVLGQPDLCGTPCEDTEEFQDIESELMKRGTLAHGQIRWSWVAEQAVLLLRTQTKDYRLLSALLQTALHAVTDARLQLAVASTARFLTLWGKQAYPRGRGRMPHIQRVVDTIETLTAKAADDVTNIDDLADIKAALTTCSNLLAELAPDLGVRLAVLPARLDVQMDIAVPQSTSADLEQDLPATTASPVVSHSQPPLAQPAPRPENLRLDASNERGLKQSLSVVADFLLDLDPAHPLSYRLRRFATWYGIASPPPIKSGTRTVLQSVSEDIIEGYRSAAERGSDAPAITQKLERSCHLQPFWLEGQMLAYRLARACGRDTAAYAIREETARFAAAVPGVAGLGFSDGTPILPKEVVAWLGSKEDEHGANAQPGRPALLDGGSPSFDHDIYRIAREARAKAGEGDLAGAMRMLDTTQVVRRDGRGRALWELVLLECLSEWGMVSHASTQALRLKDFVSGLSVGEWEPDIIDRIGRLTKSSSKRI